MPGYYINFYFRELCYDDDEIIGEFSAPDYDTECSFSYDRHTGECEIWNNNRPLEETEPLPIWYLLQKLRDEGSLNERESRICF